LPVNYNNANALCAQVTPAGYKCKADNANHDAQTWGENGWPNLTLWHAAAGNSFFGWAIDHGRYTSPENDRKDDCPSTGHCQQAGPPEWAVGAVPMHFQSFTVEKYLHDLTKSKVVTNYLAADATATWGTIAEPYASYIPQPIAFYDYFLNGNKTNIKHFNFAESLYQAVTTLNWRWLAIGDPLYLLPDQARNDTAAPKITNIQATLTGSTITVSWSNLVGTDGTSEVTRGKVVYDGIEVKDTTHLTHPDVLPNMEYVQNYLSTHSIEIPATATTIQIVATDPVGHVTTTSINVP